MLPKLMLFACALVLSCGGIPPAPGGPPPATAADLTVSAALSLKNAFQEIGPRFEQAHPGVKVLYNFGASGALAQQIKGGAPVDVFAAAALKDMDDLEAAGLLRPETRRNFAANSVVLVQPESSPGPLRAFADLAAPAIRKIAAGNPQTVPAGRYAQEVFAHFHLREAIQDKLVFAENVRQVLDYVARGEVDAGVVYRTDALTRPREVKVAAAAPPESHMPVLYPIAVLKQSHNDVAAREFVAALTRENIRAIFKKYGFTSPDGR